MPNLTVVKSSDDLETIPKRRPTLYKVLAIRLRNWEPADYNNEFLALLEMIRDAQVPKRYQSMMVRAVVGAYIQFDYMTDEEKDEVADTIESLNGVGLVQDIYNSSPFNSRRNVLLKQLSYHMRFK